jgi:hypothetical protein
MEDDLTLTFLLPTTAHTLKCSSAAPISALLAQLTAQQLAQDQSQMTLAQQHSLGAEAHAPPRWNWAREVAQLWAQRVSGAVRWEEMSSTSSQHYRASDSRSATMHGPQCVAYDRMNPNVHDVVLTPCHNCRTGPSLPRSSLARRHGTKDAPWTRRVWLFSAGARSGKAVWAWLASSKPDA